MVRLRSRPHRRDHGCSFPGCDTPPAWTQAHHITPWADGGLTNLDNLTLICGFHHREFERQGWACHQDHGVPWWTPPTSYDPDQTPIQNKVHHHPLAFPTLAKASSGPP